jgi:hypothetical protein
VNRLTAWWSKQASGEAARLRATMLVEALNDLGGTAASRFHGRATGTTAEVLAAYADDHLCDQRWRARLVRLRSS